MNYSFFSKSDVTREDVLKFMRTTEKPFKYTYGFKYRNPTTYEVPISREKAIDIFVTNSLTDVRERDTFIDINSYSSNDMW